MCVPCSVRHSFSRSVCLIELARQCMYTIWTTGHVWDVALGVASSRSVVGGAGAELYGRVWWFSRVARGTVPFRGFVEERSPVGPRWTDGGRVQVPGYDCVALNSLLTAGTALI